MTGLIPEPNGKGVNHMSSKANTSSIGLDAIANRRWWSYREPFPYIHATGLFVEEFYRLLEVAFAEVLGRGLSDVPSKDLFSRNMPNSDAYAWNFPSNLEGPLALFYTRVWHDLLCGVTGTTASGDVNGAPSSSPGRQRQRFGPP